MILKKCTNDFKKKQKTNDFQHCISIRKKEQNCVLVIKSTWCYFSVVLKFQATKKKYNFEHENQQHIANKKKYFEIELDVDISRKVLFSKYIFT